MKLLKSLGGYKVPTKNFDIERSLFSLKLTKCQNKSPMGHAAVKRKSSTAGQDVASNRIFERGKSTEQL